MTVTIGIDVGGTFTDVVAWDRAADQLHTTKVPSTPPALEEGVVRGIRKVLEIAGRRASDVERIIHGTTISLNAILERKGARLGILTTAGFEGTLAIGRARRTSLYDYFIDAETPLFLCERRRIYGVSERVGADGEVLEPLDEADVVRAIETLHRDHQVDAIAVCYLHAFANPAHEQRTAQIIGSRVPGLPVSLSSVVDPRFREYERLCLTAFDAYVKPVTARYIRRLEDRLSELGISSTLQIMQCRGGITNASGVLERPVVTVMSGPAAGVIGGQFAGALAGERDLMTVDIGGTSCDIALIRDGQPLISLEGRVDNYPLRQPMVDVASIGAGGGSIAWLDDAGGLRVGPRSAGANPGPACYGRGGAEPTVTDASLLLGYLNPTRFAYGEVAPSMELAEAAVGRVAEPLGLTIDAAALGIHRIINSRMADEMRLASIGRGLDPRRFALVAQGGGGAVHAGRLAELLSIPRVLVPPAPGVLSAFGLVVANVEHEQSQTFGARLDTIEPAELSSAFGALEAAVLPRMVADGVPPDQVQTSRSAEMRYRGQSYEIEIGFPDGPLDASALDVVAARFHARHGEIYSHATPDVPIEVVNLRVVQRYPLPKPAFTPEPSDTQRADVAIVGRRRALFDLASGFVDVPVYDRPSLPIGSTFVGPAIVEQPDTTTVLYPGHEARVDAYRNLIINIPQQRPEPRLAGADRHMEVRA